MRWIMRSVLSWIVITVVPMSIGAQTPKDRDACISGRLIFEQGNVSCERVLVELEVIEMQAIDAAYADSSCAFRFLQVSPGSYYFHIDVDGYVEIRQRVEVSESIATGNNIIQMNPA